MIRLHRQHPATSVLQDLRRRLYPFLRGRRPSTYASGPDTPPAPFRIYGRRYCQLTQPLRS